MRNAVLLQRKGYLTEDSLHFNIEGQNFYSGTQGKALEEAQSLKLPGTDSSTCTALRVQRDRNGRSAGEESNEKELYL